MALFKPYKILSSALNSLPIDEGQVIVTTDDQGLYIDATSNQRIKIGTTDLASKQDALVSGTNIKTINNQSLLGSGNINVEATAVKHIDVTDNTQWDAEHEQPTQAALQDIATNEYYILSVENVPTGDQGETLGVKAYLVAKFDGNDVHLRQYIRFEEGDPEEDEPAGIQTFTIGNLDPEQPTVYQFTPDITAFTTDVQINGTSIVDDNVANLVTNTAYNASSNKIATMSDIENSVDLSSYSAGTTISDSTLVSKLKQDNVIVINGTSRYRLADTGNGSYLYTVMNQLDGGDYILLAESGNNLTVVVKDNTNWQLKIDASNKLSADYVDDTNTTNKFVTASDKTTWNSKVDKNVNDLTYYYTKTEVDGKVSSVYKYKGTVSTYVNLPSSGQTTGDVYNIEQADSTHGIKAGDNVAWNGSAWDKLGGDIDLSGYQTKIDSSHKISADLVDDSSATNKFVTSSDKTAWNAKYSKPSGGIPSTDMTTEVQTSLGKADSALQSISSTDVTTALGYTPYNATNPNGYTSNTGTITGITMNGSSKGTSGVVNLGTVITSHQDISGKQDALVSGTNIKTINNNSVLGSGNLSLVESTVVVSNTEPSDPNVEVWIDTSEAGVIESKFKNKTWHSKAHRGNIVGHESTLRENTLGAYYHAFTKGADVIEVDARLSSDNVFMCNHDTTVTDINEVTYTIANTTAAALQALVLSTDSVYGNQGVPTLESVLKLAYTCGMKVDIDLKMFDSGMSDTQKRTFASNVAKLVAKCGMKGRATYAIQNAGALVIPEIIAIDPEASFVAQKSQLDAISNLSTILPNYKDKCYAYTADLTASTIEAIRTAGYRLEVISIDNTNFSTVIQYYPDNIEYLHTTDFRTIEDAYFNSVTLY